jgi:hypothetical protein
MKTITVKGAQFHIPTAEEAGIVAGYTLDAAAAKHLYQTRCDRIRNNVTPVVKKMMDNNESQEAIARRVWEYASNYSFSMPGQRGRVYDPAVKEQYVIAREYLRDYLKNEKGGRKLTDVPEGMTKAEWQEKVKANLESIAHHPDTVALAQKRIAAKGAPTPRAFEGINLP